MGGAGVWTLVTWGWVSGRISFFDFLVRLGEGGFLR